MASQATFPREIYGVNSDEYVAPVQGCCSPGATIPVAIDRTTGAQLVTQAGAAPSPGFAIPEYDNVDFTYVAAGNGAGEIETITYSLAGTTVATLTFSYDASDNVSSIVKS